MSFDKVFHAFKEGCNAVSGIPHYVTSPPKKLYLERFFLDQHDHVAKFLRTHKEMGWIQRDPNENQESLEFSFLLSLDQCQLEYDFSAGHVFH